MFTKFFECKTPPTFSISQMTYLFWHVIIDFLLMFQSPLIANLAIIPYHTMWKCSKLTSSLIIAVLLNQTFQTTLFPDFIPLFVQILHHFTSWEHPCSRGKPTYISFVMMTHHASFPPLALCFWLLVSSMWCVSRVAYLAALTFAHIWSINQMLFLSLWISFWFAIFSSFQLCLF